MKKKTVEDGSIIIGNKDPSVYTHAILRELSLRHSLTLIYMRYMEGKANFIISLFRPLAIKPSGTTVVEEKGKGGKKLQSIRTVIEKDNYLKALK